MKENGSALVLLDERVPNELDSSCAGAMGCSGGGVGVAGGGGSPRSNHNGARERCKNGGVGGGVGRTGHRSCTRFHVPTELDDCLIGAGGGGGGAGEKETWAVDRQGCE